MKNIFLFLLLLYSQLSSEAQAGKKIRLLPQVAPQDTVVPRITMKYLGNDTVQFSTRLRPLRQVAGAPPAFYTYFWEFGDGTFSDATLTEPDKPRHRYKENGTYQVRLYATNNHDDGLAPPSVPQSFAIHVNTKSNSGPVDFFNGKEKNIQIKINRNPKPGEEMVAYIGYRNKSFNNFKGSLILFFNERQFQKCFFILEKRTYNEEESATLNQLLSQSANPELSDPAIVAGDIDKRFHRPSGNWMHTASETNVNYSNNFLNEPRASLKAVEKDYKENVVLRFNNLQKNEERFVFFTLRTLPEMIQDTNMTITMTAMLVPDNSPLPPEKFELEMPIVASHDPNQMLLRQHRINYRFMGKTKELTYKVQFQNTGKGPSKNITIGIALPKQLNATTLQVKRISPAPVWCDSAAHGGQSCVDTLRTADSIYFVFNNIYLPGMQQNLVKNTDSTKGFVEYSIRFKKKPKKIAFRSRAVIVFDKNKPIYTNNAMARFVKGISPGIIAGYNFSMSNGSYSAKGPVQIGYVLAPYAPSRPYFQVELHAGILQQEDSMGTDNKAIIPANIVASFENSKMVVLQPGRMVFDQKMKRNLLQIVPLHFRYNINDWVGVGLGVMGQIAISEQSTNSEKYYFSGLDNRYQTPRKFDTSIVIKNVQLNQNNSSKSGASTKFLTEPNIATFADLQIGRVRTGPTLGLRYYRQWKGNIPNRFFIYAGIKL